MVDYDYPPPPRPKPGIVTYREADVTQYPLSGEKPLHPGPRDTCPACGLGRSGTYQNDNYISKGVTSSKVCKTRNWFMRLFGGCKEVRRHTHQSCENCHAVWANGFKDEGYA